jgi:hypothetical protein
MIIALWRIASTQVASTAPAHWLSQQGLATASCFIEVGESAVTLWARGSLTQAAID